MKLLIMLLIIIAVLMTTLPAKTEENDKIPQLFELSLEELLNVKISIASRRIETISDAPSSVTVYTSKELLEMGITSLDELYNYIPGMQSVRRVFDARFETAAVRGVGHTWGDGVQLMVNGLRQQDSYSGGSALFNRMFSLENVERVEVIRGPGSSMYGANAFLGVINVITSNNKNNSSVSVDSFNSSRASFNYSREGDDWSYSFFANVFKDDGDDFENLNDQFARNSLSNDPVKGNDLSAYFQYSNFSVRARLMKRETRNFYNWGFLSNDIARNKTDYFQLSAEYKLPLPKKWQGTISASNTVSNWRATGIFVTEGIGPFQASDFIAGPVMEDKDQTFSSNFGYDFSQEHQVNFGLQYEKMSIPKAGHNSNYDFLSGFSVYLGEIIDQYDDSIRFVIDNKRTVVGAYVQDQYHWNSKLMTTLGLRYDHFTDFGSSINPRAAINYQYNKHHKLKLMYGEAFRAPSMNNLGTQNNPAIVGNIQLKPETVTSFEFAHLYSNDNLEIVSTFYHNQIDKIITQTTTADGLVQYENAGTNRTTGFEFEIIYIANKQLHLRANWSHIFSNKTKLNADSTIDRGEHFLPKQLLSFILTYKKGNYTVNLTSFMRGKIVELPDEKAVAIFNTNIQYQINEQSSVFFTIKNLFDDQFLDVATGSGVGITENNYIFRKIPNRGRQIILGYRYAF